MPQVDYRWTVCPVADASSKQKGAGDRVRQPNPRKRTGAATGARGPYRRSPASRRNGSNRDFVQMVCEAVHMVRLAIGLSRR